MKRLTLLSLLGLGFTFAQAQDARLQVIHNAADPLADTVDVWVNGVRTLSNFAFREATGFLNLPAATYRINITGNGAADTTASVVATSVTLTAGMNYQAIANGNAGGGFVPNPDSRSTSVQLYVLENVELNATSTNTKLRVFHGSTDAPYVDVQARSVATLVNNAAYGDATGHFEVPAADYVLDITDSSGNTRVISFDAPLSGLNGQSLLVLASGYLNTNTAQPANRAFGLIAVDTTGNVISLPVHIDNAMLQLIHNAADPLVSSVDVWLDGAKAVPGFAFRTATRFLTIPEGKHRVNITAAGATDTLLSALAFDIDLVANENYVAVANGNAGTGFEANPDGRNTTIGVWLLDGASLDAAAGEVNLRIIHGSTDAPTVDVRARNVATLADDAAYGDFSGTINVPAAGYIIDIADATGTVYVKSYQAPLSTAGGAALTVLASGYLNTTTAQPANRAFAIIAVDTAGNVITLPEYNPTARLQAIHNAADPAADTVDVWAWVEGTANAIKLIDNFGFRSATPFIDIQADLQTRILVAGKNSTTLADTIAGFSVGALAENETYLLVAQGVLNPASFESNPSGVSTAFGLLPVANAKEQAGTAGQVDITIIHGSTDAPAVDIKTASNNASLVSNARYGDVAMLSAAATDDELDVYATGQPNPVASFKAPLSVLRDSAAVVFASGFLTPGNDQNGAGFELWVALPNGQTFALDTVDVITSMNNAVTTLLNVYPNPASDFIYLDNANNQFNQVIITDLLGRSWMEIALTGNKIDIQTLPAGVYQLNAIGKDVNASIKILVH